MKYSTVLLFISWIPLIQLSFLPFEFFYKIEDVYIPFLISLLLSVIAVWLLLSIKNIRKNTPPFRIIQKFTLVFGFLIFPSMFSLIFSYILCESRWNNKLILFIGYGFLVLILTVVGLWFWNHYRKRKGKTSLPAIVTILVAAGYPVLAFAIPAVYIRIYHFPDAKDSLPYYYLVILLALSFLTAFAAVVIFLIRREVKPYKLMIHFIFMMFCFLFLFGIPINFIIKEVFKIGIFSFPERYTGLIISIISSVISFAALVLAWKETRKQDKPYIPALKVILASVFVLWQINTGFHLYLNFSYFGDIAVNLSFWSLEWWPFVVFRILLFILFCIAILCFSLEIFSRKKSKLISGWHLFFSGTGLVMVLGTYVLIACLEKLAKFVRILDDFNPIVMSFITVIEPILSMALVFALMGVVFSFLKRKDLQPPYPETLRTRKTSIGISLISIFLYLILFKSFWPLQYPSMDILIKMLKKYERPGSYWDQYQISIASYAEIISFGKLAVKPMINTLKNKDEGEFIRLISPEILGIIGDRRAVKPLLRFLDDPNQELRKYVIRAVSYFKDPTVVEALIERMGKEKSKDMIKEINLTLGWITEEWCKEKEDNMQKWWQQWWKKNKKDFIARHARSEDSR